MDTNSRKKVSITPILSTDPVAGLQLFYAQFPNSAVKTTGVMKDQQVQYLLKDPCLELMNGKMKT